MPLYNINKDYAQIAMQGQGDAARTFGMMPKGSKTEVKQEKGIGDAIIAGGGGALMGAQLAGTTAGAAALTSPGGMLGLGAGTTAAAGTAAAGGAASGAATGAASGSVAGPLGMGIGALAGIMASMFL